MMSLRMMSLRNQNPNWRRRKTNANPIIYQPNYFLSSAE
jgi:hypothetical protein